MRTEKKQIGAVAPLAHPQKSPAPKDASAHGRVLSRTKTSTSSSLTTRRRDAGFGLDPEQNTPDRDKLAANVTSAKVIGALAAKAAWTRASRKWCLTAAARVITARSRRWRMPRAKRD
jgi:hypothetical protein